MLMKHYKIFARCFESILILFVFSFSAHCQIAQFNVSENIPPDQDRDYVAAEAIKLINNFTARPDASHFVKVRINENLVTHSSYSTFPIEGNYSINTSLPVGAIKNVIDVTQTGAATCNIPIFIPPGTAGIQPQISIVYNSQGGNGILGIGWDISGLSAITRVGQTFYHDGNVTSVNLNSTDRFALDGNRLILSGGFYHTELESFSKIEALGIAGDGPAYFRVTTKDGNTLEYGNTTDSRIEPQGSSTPFMWRLNKVTDLNGNYMEYVYNEQNGESRIESIKYTKNDAAGISHYNTVKFFYRSRWDQNKYFIAGAEVNQTVLLRAIRVESEGKTVREYQFKYASGSSFSHLTEIVEYGANGKNLNATVVYWGEETSQISFSLNTQISGSLKLIPGDFNGDGKTDLLVFADKANFLDYGPSDIWYIEESNGDGTFSNTFLHTFDHSGYHFVPELTKTGDLNGDGTDDILFCFYDDDDPEDYLFVPVFYTGGTYIISTATFNWDVDFLTSCRMINVVIDDFNGDGKNDVLISDRINACMGIPSQTMFIVKSYNSGSWNNLFNKSYENFIDKYHIIDFNGNGKADIMIIRTDDLAPNHTCQILEYNNSYTILNTLYDSGFPTRYHTIFPGDFNGDGKTDLLTFADNGSGGGTWYLNFSTGMTFSSNYTVPWPLASVNLNSNPVRHEILVGDYNGDGKDDILDMHATEVNYSDFNIYYAGNILNVFHPESNSVMTSCYPSNSSNICIPDFINIIDINGDGKQDIIFKTNFAHPVYCPYPFKIVYFHKDEKRNLVQSITNGFNQTIQFKYSPLTSNEVINGTAFYVKGSGDNFPVLNVQMPLYVVKKLTVPDGIGGTQTTNYYYENARIHKQGRGFLGFEKIIADNVTTGWKIINHYKCYDPFWFTVLDLSETFKNGNLVSKTDYFNMLSWCTSSNPASFKYNQIIADEHDILKNTHKESFTSFTLEGDVHSAVTFKAGNNSEVLKRPLPTYGVIANVNGLDIRKVTHVENEQKYYSNNTFKSPISFEYYPNGNLKKEIAFPGLNKQVTTHYDYFSCGLPQKVTVSASGHADRITEYEYDNKFRFVTKITNPAGNFSTRSFNPDGTLKSETDINNLTTYYKYDGFGRMIKTLTPEGHLISMELKWANGTPQHAVYYSETTAPGRPTVKTWYDALGRELRTETDGFNGIIISTEKQYNNKGQLTQASKPSFGSPSKLITYQYDNYDRPWKVTDNGNTITTDYSNLTLTTNDPQNPAAFSERTFNSAGDLISSTDHGGTISYTYHSNGKPLSITVAGVTTTMNYDDYGRQVQLTDPNAGITQYEYDAFGQLISQTDANSNTWTYTYNLLGQPLIKTCSDGTVCTYTYVTSGNGKQQLASVSCTGGSQHETSQSFQYDQFGRVTQFTDALPDKIMVTKYEYDAYGNLIKQTYPSGFSIKFSYDASGYMTSISKASDNTPIWTLNSVNAYGQPLQYTAGNNMATNFIYDSNDMLANISSSGIQDMDYIFDAQRGNLNSRINQKHSLSENFTYDNLNRLRGYTSTVNGVPGPDVSVDIDANGNITSKTDAGSYSYSSSKPHAVTGITGNSGSIATAQQDITYTAFNSTASITEGNKSLTFTYNPDQQRIKTVFTDGVVTKTKYFSTDYEEEVTAVGTRKLHYISSPYGLAAIYIDDGVNPQMYYVLKDHLGSITGLVDQNGNLVEEYSYDAWGRRRNPATGAYLATATNPNYLIDRGYTGHEHLDEFGLINMNGRLYDPVLGRMLSPDNYVQDATSTQTFNRYSYAHNNPLSYVDPDGENPFLIAAIVVGAYLGGSIVNHNFNPLKWNYKAWQTYAGIAVGGAAGVAGYYAAVGAYAGMSGGAFATQFGASTIYGLSGSAAGASAGFILGFGSNFVNGGNFSSAFEAGGQFAAFGSVLASWVGGSIGAQIENLQKSIPNIVVPPEDRSLVATLSSSPQQPIFREIRIFNTDWNQYEFLSADVHFDKGSYLILNAYTEPDKVIISSGGRIIKEYYPGELMNGLTGEVIFNPEDKAYKNLIVNNTISLGIFRIVPDRDGRQTIFRALFGPEETYKRNNSYFYNMRWGYGKDYLLKRYY
jgi:RHS repeat-associated protein